MNSDKGAEESKNNNEEEKVDKSLRRQKAIKKGGIESSSPTGSLKSDSEDED